MRNHLMYPMNINPKETSLYAALFSTLGIFSYLLLIESELLSEQVSEMLSPLGAPLFFIAAFNLLGYFTMRASSWVNRQYALNTHRRWKVMLTYAAVMFLYLGLNYALLISAKLLVGAARPFVFPNGGWRILIVVWLVELVILGLLLANRSMKHTLVLQRRAADLQRENNTARYTALQQQLNPHFLFNSLNTLVAEIEYNPRNAALFTRRLSDVYRYVLQSQDKTLIPLSDELEFVRAYLFLHEVRLGNCITCRTDIVPETTDNLVPPLTLQLLIENVIKHNIISPARPMEISIRTQSNNLIVSNPVHPKKNPAPSGVGLRNLSNRYRLLTGHDITIESTPESFTVTVPFAI